MKLAALLLLTMSAVAAIWGSLSLEPGKRSALTAESRVVVATYLQAGVLTQYAASGEIAERLEIESAVREVSSSESALREIRYRASGKNETLWDIQASRGTFLEDADELLLTDGVEINEISHAVMMSTPSAHLFLGNKRALGNQKVLLTGQGSKTVGDGFELDLATNTATLKGNVQTDYE
jgi:LPS export ABC transporter protein LptC